MTVFLLPPPPQKKIFSDKLHLRSKVYFLL